MTDRGRHPRGVRALLATAGCAGVVALAALPARATTYVLDASGGGDFESLEPAVAAAATGDTILVAPGFYTGEENARVDFLGKDIVLRSTNGPEVTTFGFIHGPGFRLESGETEATVIEGLTLTAAESAPVSFAVNCDGSAVTIRDCIFTEISGIALSLRGPRQSTVSDCRFTENASGIWLNGVEANIRSCTFTENGPPQYFWQGGAIGMSSICGEILIEDCTFVGNIPGRDGGAIMNEGVDQLLVVDCVFEGNRAGRDEYYPPGFGGPEIVRCTFTGNTAARDGGAIYRWRTNFTATDCIFEGNTAPRGGAVCCFDEYEWAFDSPKISGCTFTSNRAEMGAAVMCVESAARVDSCLFDGNRAPLWGGGLCASGAHDRLATVTHSTFTRNSSHRGAALLANVEARLTAEYCTFYGCEGDDGTIVSLVDGFIDVANSVISFAPGGAPIHLQFAAATAEHCVVFGNAGGDSLPGGSSDNLFADPLFCDVYHDNFTLCENSPCLADNNDWGEPVGAHGVGCGNCDSPVRAVSWGAIKAMYR
jgi:hypothetical protein